jgi:hypothetical protein
VQAQTIFTLVVNASEIRCVMDAVMAISGSPGATTSLNGVYYSLSPRTEADAAAEASHLAMRAAVAQARAFVAEAPGMCLGPLVGVEPPRMDWGDRVSSMVSASSKVPGAKPGFISSSPSSAFEVEIVACFHIISQATSGGDACALHY